jgi:hypothetical protein
MVRWTELPDGSYLGARGGRTFYTKWRTYGHPRRGGEWSYGEIVDGVKIVWGETPLLISARVAVDRRAAA